jgi:hypothetical protein
MVTGARSWATAIGEGLKFPSLFAPGVREAAVAITCLSPGLRCFHPGRLEGGRRWISPHLAPAAVAPVDEGLQRSCDRLFGVLRRPAVRDGQWRLPGRAPAWDGSWTWDGFIASAWETRDGCQPLIAVRGHRVFAVSTR